MGLNIKGMCVNPNRTFPKAGQPRRNSVNYMTNGGWVPDTSTL